MLYLTHNDDCKCKNQSHTIRFINKESDDKNKYIYPEYSILDITGYGATKDEALHDFEEKLYYLFNEYNAIKNLWECGVYDDLIEIDGLGNVIGEKHD